MMPTYFQLPFDMTIDADCTQTRHEAKLAHYSPHLPSLLRENISYTPIVWSAYGRPHRDTLTVLCSLIESISRKRNFVSAEVVYQKLHASITLEIRKRSALQIWACWPLAALPDSLWTLNHSPCLGPWALSLSLLCRSALLRRASRLFLSWTVSSLWRVLLSVLSRFLCSVLELGHVPRGVPPLPGRAAVLPRHSGSRGWAWRSGCPGSASGFCGPDPCHGACLSSRAPALICPRPHLVVFVAPSCSTSVAPRVFPSRALLWPRLTARSPLVATPSIMPTYFQLFFGVTIFRSSIQDGTKFDCQWSNSHLMTSWKVCTN